MNNCAFCGTNDSSHWWTIESVSDPDIPVNYIICQHCLHDGLFKKRRQKKNVVKVCRCCHHKQSIENRTCENCGWPGLEVEEDNER